MKKHIFACILAAFTFCYAVEKIPCEGSYNWHLQGVANDETNIWWSFTGVMLKTDLTGKILNKVDADFHHGDLCLKDGKIYVAVNLNKFNTEKDADSWVYIYNANDLSFIEKIKLPELCHGAGGITFANGSFYVVGGLPATHNKNYVYEYSVDFKFIKRHDLDTGYTKFGIQTASFYDGKFYFGCYDKEIYGYRNTSRPVTIIASSDLKSYKKSYVNTSCGLAKIGNDFYAGFDKKAGQQKTYLPRAAELVKIKEIDRPLKVLAIGNSFTLSLHNNKHLMEAIKAANANIMYAVMYIGGCPLEKHWKNIELFDKDPNAKPYLIRSNDEKLNSKSNIPQMIAKDDWDIVTVQQASHFSFKPETYEPYMTLLMNYFKKKCPKAEVVIQQTWSYCDLFNRAQQVGAGTPKEMYTKLCGAYLAAAKKHRIRIIPTGVAVEKAREALKMNFGPLSKEELEKYVYPNLPKSTIECGEVVGNISWRKGKDGIFKIGGDPIHLNYDGEYLQSFTWLKFLAPEIDIVNVNYVPKKIPAEKARILRQAAADAVNQGLK